MDTQLFQSIINNFTTTKDKNGNSLNMKSIMITCGTNTFTHNFTNDNLLVDIRSISKPIICLALGCAINEGLYLGGERVGLDTKIFPFFKDIITITNIKNIEKLERVTLRHVLTHSIGYADGLLFNKDIKDKDPFSLLDFVFNYDIVYEPGEHFVYSNVGPYIISALIQECLHINLSVWVNDIIFKKMEIKNYEWKNYGKYCAGASGLKLGHDDLHKIGLLLLNGGEYNNEQIVPRNWVEQMTKIQISTPSMYDEKRVLPKYGYGFYLYICKNGNFYCDGTDGQYLIVLPQKHILITTLGNQGDMKPITECLRDLIEKSN